MGSINSSIISPQQVTILNGVPFYTQGETTVISNTAVTVFSFTVPASTTRELWSLFVTSAFPGHFVLYVGALAIVKGHIYEAEKNVEIKFEPRRPIAGGSVVTLEYTGDDDFTTSCPVFGFLAANDI